MSTICNQLPQLGVGLNYQPTYKKFIRENKDLVDFIEVSPDVLCRNFFDGQNRKLKIHSDRMSEFKSITSEKPVVVHGLNLSIGSATGMNYQYLDVLDDFSRQQEFLWHSEHIGFMGVMTEDGDYIHSGTQLPIPFNQEVIDMLVPRIKEIQGRQNKVFLMENTAYYLPDMNCSTSMDEIEFLNQLSDKSGCGLLLDIYNFYCNAVNFNFDPIKALERLHLENVVEVHIAGGVVQNGYLVDVHSEHTPSAVWEMLEYVVARAPNLKAIVYELLEQAYGTVGDAGIAYELLKAKNIWQETQSVRSLYSDSDVDELESDEIEINAIEIDEEITSVVA